ncbi:hypothetical protein PGT21_050274 [Puccinia graminis f. sp. tritici]|uniref:Transposase domain-containing protein n=1 Tax=Puccinia graminis f. sp. tritici TaxID=56615 RepID=A0A5B0N8W1_PUCGR|nr:hypothetical protein PGT21_050274 [Puccinia graminis f. sp. tritici]KAA1099219.1 hypothetical protein PGTUg99_050285 [Puccinia graminis f. sp. tritici]KAA1123519.1 hypothetical protein PGTUg99_050198 [Puccinia graminis f. sp. tritici]
MSSSIPRGYVICTCLTCGTKQFMTPNGLRQGVPFTKNKYELHMNKSIPSQATNEIDERNRSNQTYPYKRNSSQNLIQTMPYKIQSSSIPTAPEPSPGIPIFQTEKWANYSWKQNDRHVVFPMVFTSILSLCHKVSRESARFLIESLNIQNKIVISELSPNSIHQLGQIPLSTSTIFDQLNLNPDLDIYACCPDCLYLVGLEREINDPDITCQRHLQRYDLDGPCHSQIGKMKISTNIKEKPREAQESKFEAIQHFVYQPFKSWLGRFLQQPGIEEDISIHLQRGSRSIMTDIWDGYIWKQFTGKNESQPFLSKAGNLAFALYIDWFNAFGKSSRKASLGTLILVCLNLPPEKRLKPENVYVAGILPGPKEPTGTQLNNLLLPLIQELKELWEGVYFSQTFKFPQGTKIRVAMLTVIADLPAIRKIAGFKSHSGTMFCNFCTISKEDRNTVQPFSWRSRNFREHKENIARWLNATSNTQREKIFKETGARYSILEELPYWDPTRMINLDIMHNMILGALKDHAENKLRIAEKDWKDNPRKSKSSDGESSEDSDTEEEIFYHYTEKVIDSRAARILRREAAADLHNLPAKRVSQNPLANTSQHTPSQKGRPVLPPTSNLTERYHDDLDFVPISVDNPSSENQEGYHQSSSDHFKFNPQLLNDLRELIKQTSIPSDWTRVPKNIGEKSHGSLKAAEWLILYKLYIPMLMIIKEKESDPFPEDIFQNTFHLISSLNISTSWTTNSQSGTDFTRHWAKYRQISKEMYPDVDAKPNHHMSTHIPELNMRWGPSPCSATWAYERLNGIFSSFGNNNSVDQIPLTILQNICRLSNLKSLVKYPTAPPEVKQLSSFLEISESSSDDYLGTPIKAEVSIYKCFVEYLRNLNPSIHWLSSYQVNYQGDNPENFVVSPWWIYHPTINWKKKTFTTYEKHQGNSIICYYDQGSSNFGKILAIFTVNDPYKKIKGYFMVINPFDINDSFFPEWPNLNIYQARPTSHQVIIKCEDIDCHCALYMKNGFFLLTKLYLSFFSE